MKYKIEFGFGVGEDASGRPLLPSEVAIGMQRIRQRAAELFGGYTTTPTYGGWINPEGRLVEEPGYTLSVLAEYGTINEAVPFSLKSDQMVITIKEALRQQAVVMVITRIVWDIV